MRAAQTGIPPDDVAELQCLVLGHYKEAFCRGLTGEPPAQVGPMRLVWTPSARTTNLGEVETLRSGETIWLLEQMQRLERAHMVYLNPQATFASVAMALPKGDTYRMVADYRVANNQLGKVPLPHPRLDEVQSFF